MVFGKMPGHGDFVARAMTPEAAARWDGWIAGELLGQRVVLGEAFQDRFDRAPVWRFAIAEDDAHLVGAMAPSADAVGRRFPLIAARTADTPDAALAEACEDLLYKAIGGGWSASQLAMAVDKATAARGDPPPADWWTLGNDDFPKASCAGAHPAGLFALMLTPRADAVR